MDDKNKIKNLEIQIDNLITEKHIKERSDDLLKLHNKKKEENLMNDIIRLLDDKNNDVNLNTIDILLGILLIISVIIDINGMCSLNIIVFCLVIVILICISIFNEWKFTMLVFIKIILGICLIGIVYFEKMEYFDLNMIKVGIALIGLYIIYNSFNKKNIVKNERSLPDYRNKIPEKVKLNIDNKRYEGGEFKGCVNIENINTDESENKVFYKGSVYNLGQQIIDNKEVLEVYKNMKKNSTGADTDNIDKNINNRYIYSQWLSLLSRLKKNNNNADLVFLSEIYINDKKTYSDMNDNVMEYTKKNITDMIKLITDSKYLIGSICFNNLSI